MPAPVGLQSVINNISNLTICWGHTHTSIASGLSTQTIKLPVSMYVYGESVSTGTRTTNIMISAYNYSNNTLTTDYKLGFANSTNSQQAIDAFVVVFGTT